MVNKKHSGFTLIELMIGIIISSILALTTGIMIYYSYETWDKSKVAVELQRDATLAMDILSKNIRPSNSSDIQTSGSTLTIGNKSFYLVSPGSLLYDPNSGVAGDEKVIVNNKVTALVFSKNDPLVEIYMVLEDDTETITLDNSIEYRN